FRSLKEECHCNRERIFHLKNEIRRLHEQNLNSTIDQQDHHKQKPTLTEQEKLEKMNFGGGSGIINSVRIYTLEAELYQAQKETKRLKSENDRLKTRLKTITTSPETHSKNDDQKKYVEVTEDDENKAPPASAEHHLQEEVKKSLPQQPFGEKSFNHERFQEEAEKQRSKQDVSRSSKTKKTDGSCSQQTFSEPDPQSISRQPASNVPGPGVDEDYCHVQ
ncbi:centromere-associated protein E-like, partial [Limulus polyphemus]|uniref:Centromere-associated protein E-like n=1 Tax=Limulus polyphemus TaxID=6850 RepID=A0ABM1RYY3_LIMPO